MDFKMEVTLRSLNPESEDVPMRQIAVDFLYLVPPPEVTDGKFVCYGPFPTVSEALAFFDYLRPLFAFGDSLRHEIEATVSYEVSETDGDVSLCSLMVDDGFERVAEAAVYEMSALCELLDVEADALPKANKYMVH